MPTRTTGPGASRRRTMSWAAGVSALTLTASGFALGAIPSQATTTAHPDSSGRACLTAIGSGPTAQARQRAFDAASRTYGVPTSVLLGVSYLESRWDDHGASPSTSGGYGPMHLTNVPVENAGDAKGDGSFNRSTGPASLHTARVAANLTGLSLRRLTSDDAANICGGAAVIVAQQRRLGKATGAATATQSWYAAVRQYSGDDGFESRSFASRVFETIKSGESRRTIDGQLVSLTAEPSLAVPAANTTATKGGTEAGKHIDCPATLDCQWVPAPYERTGPDPGDYGNHDIADREQNLDIDYIIIHDTEVGWKTTLDLVQDPTYLGWNYSIRSRDGKVAQHMDAKDIGFQAGNWYVNMHSIGIEHEGFAAQGAQWYTESLYQSSATLVRYLANKYSVKLDRAHIIGHDQVPGITPANVPGMHWDPGPFWDWEHYMDLLHAPIVADGPPDSNVVTVKPGFDNNEQTVTGCDDDPNTADTCPSQGTNFVYLHQAPSESAPLVTDVGLHSTGSPSTTFVSDHGARVAAGQKLVVDERQGEWLKVWYLGAPGWLHSPPGHPTVVPAKGRIVTAKAGAAEVPVYGRAYPEASAYDGTPSPVQAVVPLQYTIKAGQKYVLADDTIDTNYYYSTIFDTSDPNNHIVVTGKDTYDEIWFGHRMFFVRAADVSLN